MSKLNPQNATAYVGPGVLRKGGKITPVPNGPLIKKKGPFKGSTLKAGGKIKKAMMGMSSMFKDNPIYKKTTDLRGKLGSAALGMPGMKPIVKNGSRIKKAQAGDTLKKPTIDMYSTKNYDLKKTTYPGGGSKTETTFKPTAKFDISSVKKKKAKGGAMIKRADGSMSRRGLWDNLRSKAAQNKKTGAKPKSPSKAMLTQEKKIKSKEK